MRQHFSPYVSMGNNPINRWDPDGGMDGDPENPFGSEMTATLSLILGNHEYFNSIDQSSSDGGFWGAFGDTWIALGDGIVSTFSSWEGFTNSLLQFEKNILNLNTAGLEFDPEGNAAKWELYNSALDGDPAAFGTYTGVFSQSLTFTTGGFGLFRFKSWYGWRAISFGARRYSMELGVGFNRMNGLGLSSRLFLGGSRAGLSLDFHTLYHSSLPYLPRLHGHLGIPGVFRIKHHISLPRLPGSLIKNGANLNGVRGAVIRH